MVVPLPEGIALSAQQIEELERADWRLALVLAVLAREARLRGMHVRVTSVERTRERTAQIYREAGLTPPTSSVHDVRPCRGLDAVPVAIGEIHTDEVHLAAAEAADAVNRIVIYPRGKKAVLWHSVSAPHWHCQVPGDGLELRARREGETS
jgi:hypothetical protein